ncbi:hypothetical protein D9V37_14945 [Nocardioides mangrovicus]|uniref:Thioesterase family protein n=1 Tax=Nocardioides mangrovicus TaxID=2478913 RepID=A0A3L8P083_9ACTN|nr:hypothetical protein D9V37_14945 [Nocardioides mangrovicus]
MIVASRFNGPPRSGNGGYTCGLLAHEFGLGETVEVTLRRPPPLDVALDLRRGETLELLDGETLVAEARAVEETVDAVDPVDLETARAASEHYPGLGSHPFARCFGCGTERPDGLRVFPGPVAGDDAGRVAAAWTPAESTAADWHEYDDPTERCSVATTWTALDCIGGWACDQGERLMVLGRMTAVLDTLPAVGEPHVVVAQRVGGEGRRSLSLATLYDPDGRIVGRARHTWVAIDPSSFDA